MFEKLGPVRPVEQTAVLFLGDTRDDEVSGAPVSSMVAMEAQRESVSTRALSATS